MSVARQKKPQKLRPAPPRRGWLCYLGTADRLLFAAAFALAFFLTSHPDLWETANHSYVFLESVFSGRFLDFYEVCAAHQNSYYYINVANYNIVIYLVFGLWELPVYLFNQLFHLALNERFLIYWAKLVSAGFYVGCGFMFRRLCQTLGMKDETAFWATMFFLLHPVAFFSPMVMGQYDTLCLFFLLWAIGYLLKGQTTRFSLVMGAGVVCKFFPLLVLVPLVLLVEKRFWHILKDLALSLWLYLPTTLLFFGRTGNAAAFTRAMVDRVLALDVDTGMGRVPVFLGLYALVVLAAFFCHPQSEQQRRYLCVYLPMVVFGLLFCCVYWHPQWPILLVPFIVATTFLCREKAPWFYLDIVLSVGFFLAAFTWFPNHMGRTLFSGGLAAGLVPTGDCRPVLHFLGLVPYLTRLTPFLFCAAVAGNILFKFPAGGSTLADRLSAGAQYDRLSLRAWCWIVFAVGFLAAWLAPALLETLNAAGII